MLTLTRLTLVEIYRDGGSYEARFDTADGAGLGLWLQRSSSPDAHGLHHRWLYAYQGHERPANAVPVITGSAEERQLLGALDTFIAERDTDDPDSEIQHLKEMIDYIRRREPCFPSDLRSTGFKA